MRIGTNIIAATVLSCISAIEITKDSWATDILGDYEAQTVDTSERVVCREEEYQKATIVTDEDFKAAAAEMRSHYKVGGIPYPDR